MKAYDVGYIQGAVDERSAHCDDADLAKREYEDARCRLRGAALEAWMASYYRGYAAGVAGV